MFVCVNAFLLLSVHYVDVDALLTTLFVKTVGEEGGGLHLQGPLHSIHQGL